MYEIATTMAIVIDKYTGFDSGPKDEVEEDDLSRSLRELGFLFTLFHNIRTFQNNVLYRCRGYSMNF